MSRSKANKGCLIPTCNGDHYCRGYCMNHYVKMRRTGTPYGVRGQEEFAYEAKALFLTILEERPIELYEMGIVDKILRVLATWK